MASQDAEVLDAAVNDGQAIQDTVDVSLDSFDFSSLPALQGMLNALDLRGKLKVLKKLATQHSPRLLELVLTNATIRGLVAAHSKAILAAGVVGRQEVKRVVVRNSAIPGMSTKLWCVCDFHPHRIASFVNAFVTEKLGYVVYLYCCLPVVAFTIFYLLFSVRILTRAHTS